jgi:hypothetical protein
MRGWNGGAALREGLGGLGSGAARPYEFNPYLVASFRLRVRILSRNENRRLLEQTVPGPSRFLPRLFVTGITLRGSEPR